VEDLGHHALAGGVGEGASAADNGRKDEDRPDDTRFETSQGDVHQRHSRSDGVGAHENAPPLDAVGDDAPEECERGAGERLADQGGSDGSGALVLAYAVADEEGHGDRLDAHPGPGHNRGGPPDPVARHRERVARHDRWFSCGGGGDRLRQHFFGHGRGVYLVPGLVA